SKPTNSGEHAGIPSAVIAGLRVESRRAAANPNRPATQTGASIMIQMRGIFHNFCADFGTGNSWSKRTRDSATNPCLIRPPRARKRVSPDTPFFPGVKDNAIHPFTPFHRESASPEGAVVKRQRDGGRRETSRGADFGDSAHQPACREAAAIAWPRRTENRERVD